MAHTLTTSVAGTTSDTPARALLRRRGTVYLPSAGEQTVESGPGVDLLEADLVDRGWLLAPDLRQALTTLDPGDLVNVGSALIADCDALIGADRPHVPLFRGFPDSTPADTGTFFIERVLSLWFQDPDQPCVLCESGGTVHPVRPCGHLVCSTCFDGTDVAGCPICHRRIDLDDPFLRPAVPRPQALSTATPIRLRVLHLGIDSDRDAVAELLTMLARPTALSPTDVADFTLLLDTRSGDDLTWLPGTVPGRETKARLLGWLLRHSIDNLPVCGDLIDTATDVLRLLVVWSGGEPSMIDRPRLAAIPRPIRRTALAWLDRIEITQLVEDMRRDGRTWIRVGERLHPGEFAKPFPTAALAFATLRRTDLRQHPTAQRLPGATVTDGRVHVASLSSRVEQDLAAGRIGEVARILAERRPGELVRRLDHLLRTGIDPEGVIAALDGGVSRVAPAVLMSALGQIRTHTRVADARVFFPAGATSRAHVTDDKRPVLAPDLVAGVVEVIHGELLRRATLLPRVDRAVIDGGLDDLMAPYAQRTAARSLLTLTRGSVLPLPSDRHLRLFCHWMQASPEDDIDLDLSVALFDEAWNHTGTCDFTHLRVAHDGAVHSGDLVSAPAPLGASEFVDLDLDILAAHARYAVMVVFSFTSIPFADLPEAFAGWMLRADAPAEGEIFQPRSVEQRFDLAAPSKATVPMVIDIHERTMRWLDVAPHVTGDHHAVHRHQNQLAQVASALIGDATRGARMTIGEVARIHAAARADEVLIRYPDGISVFRRGGSEDARAFANRITRNEPDTAEPDDMAEAQLQFLVRGDSAAPDDAEVFALYPAAVNASKIRLRNAADFVADLA